MLRLLLALLSVLLVPDAVSDPAVAAVSLADVRARFARALDAAGWDRSRPEVDSLADTLTAEALAIGTEVPALRAEAEQVAADLQGAPLGAYLHNNPYVRPFLVAGYLARHDDRALAEALPLDAMSAAGPGYLLALAAVGSPAAGPLLAAWYRDARPRPGGRAWICRAALELRPTDAQPVVDAVTAAVALTGPSDDAPDCLAVLARSRAGRRWLSAALARGVPGHAAWPVAAALLLDGTDPVPAAVPRSLDAVLPSPQGTPEETDFNVRMARYIEAMASALDPDSPRVVRDLRRVAEGIGPVAAAHLAPALLRTRDPSLLASALDTLGDARTEPHYLALSLLAVGVLLPAHAPVVQARAVATLQNLQEQIRAFSIYGFSPRAVEQWVDALEATDRCRDNACLYHLLTDGTDEAAARAAALLGPRGLSALPEPVAAAVVRRVVLRDTPWLTASVLTQVRGCPTGLRGLVELARGEAPGRGLQLAPYVYAFRRQCQP